jgi:pimeloyl-ACP methyl ester carboxylesterase
MQHAHLGGVTLEYEEQGSGEPVLLIGGAHVAAGYLPLIAQPSLAERFRLIRYHKRGMAGSTHTPPPVSIADHAADAAQLLAHLGIGRAHVAGHSSGGAIALQLALDRPDLVHSLVLFEPAMFWVPGAEAFMTKAGPCAAAYAAGDREGAVAIFLSAVGGVDQDGCRAMLDRNVPGGFVQAVADADTFFTSELPAVLDWKMTAEQAATITQPVLSVVGSRTEPVFADAAALLQRWIPHVEQLTLDGLGHLLHMEDPAPVARGVSAFLARHPIRAAAIDPAAAPAGVVLDQAM